MRCVRPSLNPFDLGAPEELSTMREHAHATGESSSHLLDYAAAAVYLGTTQRHVRRLVAERRIGHVKVGRLVRFTPDDLATYVLENTRPAVR